MNDALISVDHDLPIAPNEQIFEQIRAAIQSGALGSDAPLPTVRQLAGDLGVAPNTVSKAYAILQAEGWTVSDGRRGTRVAPRIPSSNKRTRERMLRSAIERCVESLYHRGYSRSEIRAELENLARS